MFLCISTYVCMYICMSLYVHMYIHTYIFAYKHSIVEILSSSNLVACSSSFNLLVHTDWLSHTHTQIHKYIHASVAVAVTVDVAAATQRSVILGYACLCVPVCVLICMWMRVCVPVCIWCFFFTVVVVSRSLFARLPSAASMRIFKRVA